jgi:hypothetical protein
VLRFWVSTELHAFVKSPQVVQVVGQRVAPEQWRE